MGKGTSAVLGTVALAAILLGVAGCARPIGDLGRAQPGVLHDEIMPNAGKTRAELAGEPVSKFNLTDQEREMRDRIWRFLVAPHAYDWFYDVSVELQRTRLTAANDHKFTPDRYYRWLRRTEFASSRVRYKRLADDVLADLDTMPTTFRAICAVLEVDRQRGIAAREIAGIGPNTKEHAAARVAENRMHIAWFVRAVTYRYRSYSLALDHLLVETPHEEAVELDALLAELGTYVEVAQRGDFCGGGMGAVYKDQDAIPSRVLMHAPPGPVYKK